ncbi:unnamed protein product [Dicrocoelium dendriticum]|nr:unnamed protein product [Dicrocoelium dendriticum]
MQSLSAAIQPIICSQKAQSESLSVIENLKLMFRKSLGKNDLMQWIMLGHHLRKMIDMNVKIEVDSELNYYLSRSIKSLMNVTVEPPPRLPRKFVHKLESIIEIFRRCSKEGGEDAVANEEQTNYKFRFPLPSSTEPHWKVWLSEFYKPIMELDESVRELFASKRLHFNSQHFLKDMCTLMEEDTAKVKNAFLPLSLPAL